VIQDALSDFSLFIISIAKTCLILTHHKICLKCLCRYRRTRERTAKMEMAKISKGMHQLLSERRLDKYRHFTGKEKCKINTTIEMVNRKHCA